GPGLESAGDGELPSSPLPLKWTCEVSIAEGSPFSSFGAVMDIQPALHVRACAPSSIGARGASGGSGPPAGLVLERGRGSFRGARHAVAEDAALELRDVWVVERAREAAGQEQGDED